jgi:hypothetical protein
MIQIHNSLTLHDATYQCSLPIKEVISSLSKKGRNLHKPWLVPQACKLYLGQRLHQNICSLLINGDILENHLFPLDFIMKKIVLDLNVIQNIMEN